MDLALGDSIALGVGQTLRIEVAAKIGASSCWIAQHVPSKKYDTVIISAGVNDGNGNHCIEEIRSRVNAKRVIWIRPVKYAGESVDAVALKYGDTVVTYSVGRDHIHPKSYKEFAKKIEGTK